MWPPGLPIFYVGSRDLNMLEPHALYLLSHLSILPPDYIYTDQIYTLKYTDPEGNLREKIEEIFVAVLWP